MEGEEGEETLLLGSKGEEGHTPARRRIAFDGPGAHESVRRKQLHLLASFKAIAFSGKPSPQLISLFAFSGKPSPQGGGAQSRGAGAAPSSSMAR